MTIEQLGWSENFAREFAALRGADLVPGRVVRQDRDAWAVCLDGSAVRAGIRGALRHRAAGPAGLPVVGDWVALTHRAQQTPVIEAILQRRSLLTRRAPGSEPEGGTDSGAPPVQAIAANIDLLLICCGLDRDFNPRRIERYLTLAYAHGIAPAVLLTKADLCDCTAERVEEVGLLSAGAPVVSLAIDDDSGLDEVRRLMPAGSTAALVGSSGVGKSTLINRLIGCDRMRTGAVRDSDQRGRHTTTHRQLLPLPGGAVIIDTPGMRELGLSGDYDELPAAFSQIGELASACRFRDCTHRQEPGCAVRAAVDRGELSTERYESYHKQQRELAYFEIRDDPAALAERRSRWKVIHKAAQRMMRDRDKF